MRRAEDVDEELSPTAVRRVTTYEFCYCPVVPPHLSRTEGYAPCKHRYHHSMNCLAALADQVDDWQAGQMTAASCQDDHLLWSRLAIIPTYSCGTAANIAAHGRRDWQIGNGCNIEQWMSVADSESDLGRRAKCFRRLRPAGLNLIWQVRTQTTDDGRVTSSHSSPCSPRTRRTPSASSSIANSL